jgi:abortive infection bacteriophage resistance protein
VLAFFKHTRPASVRKDKHNSGGSFFARTSLKFSKPALSFEDQATLLERRGLVVADRAALVHRLEAVGYYRLCAYWHQFKQPDDSFLPNTQFDTVWQHYRFDRQLRLATIDAIERVEVAVRTALVHDLAMRCGPFAHTDIKNFPTADPARYTQFITDLREEAMRSSEIFVGHFRATYDEFPDLPIWAVCETMTFGAMFTLFNMTERRTQDTIAQRFGYRGPVLRSWLQTLNYVRNICAHHARLWNRVLAVRPVLPHEKNDPRWHGPRAISERRMFVVLTLLHQLLRKVAPQSGWRDRLFALFDRFPQVPLRPIGIPADWRTHDLWKS